MVTEKYVLVVGGAGYVGSQTTFHLNQSGYKTVVIDNLIHGHADAVIGGDFVEGDLNRVSDIESVFKKYEIGSVIHLAAHAYVGESVKDPKKYYENNITGTLNLLGVMLKYSVMDIVFSSTCATYGIPVQLPITETHPQNPINPYGASKLMVERILKDYGSAYDLRSVILRYFNAAGADPGCRLGEDHDPETHLIPLVLEAAVTDTPINVFGSDYDTPDGTCIRDYIHVCDLASAHQLAMNYLSDNRRSAVFNLGNQRGYSVKDVIHVSEIVTGKTIQIKYSQRRSGDPAILIASSELANEELGWKPSYDSLESIIGTAWEWHSRGRKS